MPVHIDQKIDKEKRRFRENRERLFEKFQITGIDIVRPEMGRKPRRPHHPVGTGHPGVLNIGIPADVGVVVADKAPAAVHLPRRFPSVFPHLFDQVKQRLMALRKRAAFRRPVVHLGIDVDGIFGVPRRRKILIPKSL